MEGDSQHELLILKQRFKAQSDELVSLQQEFEEYRVVTTENEADLEATIDELKSREADLKE